MEKFSFIYLFLLGNMARCLYNYKGVLSSGQSIKNTIKINVSNSIG